MKKGATHVDWAISMGIFLVYILLMFVFLKPASEPEYSGNALFDIVYSGLKSDASHTIKKGYLEIRPDSSVDVNEENILRIRNLKVSGMDIEWIKSWQKSQSGGLNHLMLVNNSLGDQSCEDMLAVPFDLSNERDETKLESKDCDETSDPGVDCVLEIKTKLKQGINIFWFLFSEEIGYELPDPAFTGYTDDECKAKDLAGNKLRYCLLDTEGMPLPAPKDNFTYEFGVSEVFTAFSAEKLTELNQTYDPQNTTKYKELKKKWNIPDDKNFRITIINATEREGCEFELPG